MTASGEPKRCATPSESRSAVRPSLGKRGNRIQVTRSHAPALLWFI
jgi:hypothetical protein